MKCRSLFLLSLIALGLAACDPYDQGRHRRGWDHRDHGRYGPPPPYGDRRWQR